MLRQEYKIIKPDFDSDIYTKIKRIPEIEQEFNIDTVLSYKPEEDKKVFIFADIKKGWVFSYDGKETVTRTVLKHKELLDYFKRLKEMFKDNEEVYLYELESRIKETKIFIDSQKPNKIKELTKGKTTIKLNTVLYTSWGYDQTNVEMFRVVKILGKNYFIIQEIGQKRVEGSEGFMCCSVSAGSQDLDKLPIKAFIGNDGYMSVCEKGYKRGLYVDEGEKHYKSWYA